MQKYLMLCLLASGCVREGEPVHPALLAVGLVVGWGLWSLVLLGLLPVRWRKRKS